MILPWGSAATHAFIGFESEPQVSIMQTARNNPAPGRSGGRTASFLLLLAITAFTCGKKPEPAAEHPAQPAEVIPAEAGWEKVAGGLNFPEGPAWDSQGTLYVSNCYGGWITRVAQGRVDTFLIAGRAPFTFEKTNGMAFHQGFLFACDFGAGAILQISAAGATRIYADDYAGQAFNRPNDMTFDAAGNLYFTDPKSYSREVLDGRVFRIRASDQAIELLADSLGFPNGLALSRDGKELYLCESAFERVLRFELTPEGRLRHRRVFVHLPGGDPDGLDFDSAGNLYVAHFGGAAVYVIAPDGSLRQKLAAPGKKPTNLEFGGEDLRTLFLTEVETNALYQRRVEVAGLPHR